MTTIEFLGVGSAFSQTLNQTSFVINDQILVDFGMTGPKSLRDAGYKPEEFCAFIPTHSHADHVGGYEWLALYFKYVIRKNPPPVIITQEYQREFWNSTLRGGLEYNEDKAGAKLCFSDYFMPINPKWKTASPREIHEIEIRYTPDRTNKLEIFRTKHIPDSQPSWETSYLSYGFFINDSVLITGDSRLDPELLEIYGERASVIFHDCQFFPENVHAYLGDLRNLPKRLTEKMYLIHYGDNWKEQKITEFAGFARERQRYLL